jgi:hypothetical protein
MIMRDLVDPEQGGIRLTVTERRRRGAACESMRDLVWL